MIEFGIVNIHTNENDIMFGYNVADAYKRHGRDMNEWYITYCEFID